jgi:hypothetical protein
MGHFFFRKRPSLDAHHIPADVGRAIRKLGLTVGELRRLSVAAKVYPMTLANALRGEPVARNPFHRIQATLEQEGLPQLIPLLVQGETS